jgi:pentose-5-phosphate-3-epimerase
VPKVNNEIQGKVMYASILKELPQQDPGSWNNAVHYDIYDAKFCHLSTIGMKQFICVFNN